MDRPLLFPVQVKTMAEIRKMFSNHQTTSPPGRISAMRETAMKALIRRFADGRAICNCGEAYYSNCGTGMRVGDGILRHDLPTCAGGCGANIIAAKHEIAARFVEHLGITLEELPNIEGPSPFVEEMKRIYVPDLQTTSPATDQTEAGDGKTETADQGVAP